MVKALLSYWGILCEHSFWEKLKVLENCRATNGLKSDLSEMCLNYGRERESVFVSNILFSLCNEAHLIININYSKPCQNKPPYRHTANPNFRKRDFLFSK